MLTRRQFLKASLVSGIALATRPAFGESATTVPAMEFEKLPSPDYRDVSHEKIDWNTIDKGLEFSRVNVYREKELVDIIAAVRIDPNYNKTRVINGFDYGNTRIGTVEQWQKAAGATVVINSAQYMADPAYMPCALVICDGKQKGPKFNRKVQGMLVAEPIANTHSLADLLDFQYDAFDHTNTPYAQGVQHWGIVLDRKANIRVDKTLWQANRTMVAKDKEGKMIFMTTEGGYFTLFNFGKFLQYSNSRKDRGFNIHTAMNMDGGYEASMCIRSHSLHYTTYGEFETYGPGKDATIRNIKIKIPGVIGVFPR